jgi:hypothetical protein
MPSCAAACWPSLPLRDGRLCVRDALGEVWLGDARGELQVTVTIDDPAFYRKVAAQGSVGAGESYIQGEWHCDDLVALIRCWCATATCSTAWNTARPAWVAGCCAAGTACAATAVRQPPQHRRALRPRQRFLRPVPVAGPDVLLGPVRR